MKVFRLEAIQEAKKGNTLYSAILAENKTK